MTTYNKTSLKTFFETGDVPGGQQYADFIDSCVNVAETGVQTLTGALNPTELITARVSAGNGVFTGTMNIGGITSARDIYADTIRASAFNVNIQTVSALSVTGNGTIGGNLSIAGNVSANTGVVFTSAVVFNPVIVSAAGTTQTTAALLTGTINRGKGVVDGSTTGFRPPANRAGLVQYLYNEGASANLWPPVGGTINGLAADAPFSLAASAMVTIAHLTASAMAVK